MPKKTRWVYWFKKLATAQKRSAISPFQKGADFLTNCFYLNTYNCMTSGRPGNQGEAINTTSGMFTELAPRVMSAMFVESFPLANDVCSLFSQLYVTVTQGSEDSTVSFRDPPISGQCAWWRHNGQTFSQEVDTSESGWSSRMDTFPWVDMMPTTRPCLASP